MDRLLIREPRSLLTLAACLGALGGMASRAAADVTLPRVIGDNMVLQRGQRAPIWGQAAPDEVVTVRFAEQEKRARADAAGRWQVVLDALPASAEPREMIVRGRNTLRLQNVLVGDVWLCSGQSNMEYAVGHPTAGAQPATKSDPVLAAEVRTARYPEIRLFRVAKKLQPPDVVSEGWQECGGEALAWFSAAGFSFAREIHRELGVPVGMVQAAWGGSRIEPWTPEAAYHRLKAFAPEAAREPLEIDGVRPGRYYEGMVRPLQPFALRGVLWYQGESNIIAGNDGMRYADKMEALISGWRAAWNRPDLPFYYVQLAPFLYSRRKDKLPHTEQALPELWEAQAAALAIPHTGLVPTTNLVDDLRDIHPGHKREVGTRLAALALARTYGRRGFPDGPPMFDTLKIDGVAAVVRFRNVGDGLIARDGRPLTDFEIAGADGRFVPARATIRNRDTVVVSSPDVSTPTAVRFAWRESAQPNLCNKAGWPAFPFRTNGPPKARK